MEDLNKNQIVLLTLLVSFVTSIATGIMTTSLLQEAPVEVTRNINRIVEKTIETVTPGVATTTIIQAPGEKQVTTVVVKEEDLVIDSINKNLKSIARIRQKDPSTGTFTFYGLGLVMTKEGLIVADRQPINMNNPFSVILSDGTELALTPMGVDKQTNFILFKAVQPTDTKNPIAFVPVSLADVEPRLGQTAISLGGDETNAISVGRVSSLEMKDSAVGTSTSRYLSAIIADVASKDLVDGSPLFNLSGDVVGIKLTSDSSRIFIPVSVLKKEISSLTEPQKVQ